MTKKPTTKPKIVVKTNPQEKTTNTLKADKTIKMVNQKNEQSS